VEKFLKVEDVNTNFPLYDAAQNGHTDVVDLLLQKKANVDQARAEWEVGSCALPASSLGLFSFWWPWCF
jgi:ankyrin repeat protein